MDENRTPAQANSFGLAVDEYERSRPGYPQAAIEWLVPEEAHTVLDLAAGTGKLTRSLVARGLDVVAVEPDDEMRTRLAAVIPSVRALKGTAEHIPLPDASVDAVTVAQAWHWVDEALAVPEIARVLRPGGTLGLVWNVRDERVDWVHKLGDIIQNHAVDRALAELRGIGEPFGPLEAFETDWAQTVTPESLITLVESRSYMITATDDHRRATLDAVRRLMGTNPALAGRDRFELPYRTYCFRAVVRSAPID